MPYGLGDVAEWKMVNAEAYEAKQRRQEIDKGLSISVESTDISVMKTM
ncbi:MAG: hypothetical protein H6765_06075 [Candidatus Peribacteria bacterium]|nr:MAG: hypothetical protein H6765_06075 [Candidatus Peribacteria bacterium]